MIIVVKVCYPNRDHDTDHMYSILSSSIVPAFWEVREIKWRFFQERLNCKRCQHNWIAKAWPMEDIDIVLMALSLLMTSLDSRSCLQKYPLVLETATQARSVSITTKSCLACFQWFVLWRKDTTKGVWIRSEHRKYTSFMLIVTFTTPSI